MGGVETDLWGRTTLPGLFAAGEVACTGVHGANRLASNSLLEGLVFGARAAQAMQQPPVAGRLAGAVREWHDAPPDAWASSAAGAPSEYEIRQLMWEAAGLVRDAEHLQQAVARLVGYEAAVARQPPDIRTPAGRRLASLLTVASLIAHAALRRTESRGGHFRSDFPARDDVHWSAHIVERSPY
jgi:L-aspartate oxidase